MAEELEEPGCYFEEEDRPMSCYSCLYYDECMPFGHCKDPEHQQTPCDDNCELYRSGRCPF